MSTRFHPLLGSALARTAIAAGAVAATLGSARAQQVDIPAWRTSNEHRAMKLQRELSADMPQSQSLLLGSHNSYNSSAYPGPYPFFQHSYTLYEQLDLGLRSLDLDVHAVLAYPNELWLSHASCTGAGQFPAQQTVYDGLAEIRSWLNNNPDEVLFLNFEQHFPMSYPSDFHTLLLIWVEKFLGGADSDWGPDVLIRPSEISTVGLEGGHPAEQDRAMNVTESTLTQLRAMGRVLIQNIGGVSPPCDNHYWPDSPAQDIMLGDVPSFNWCGPDNWSYVHARDFANDPQMRYWGTAAAGSKWRTACTSNTYSTYVVLYNNTSGGEYQVYGSESPSVVREAVRAGMDYIRFDPVGRSEGVPLNPIEFPADEQMRATIWSWDHRYPPPSDGQPRAAMAVIQGDTARIRWEAPTAEMRYALQRPDGNWSISSSSGAFAAAPPVSGSANFRAPGNGFEMQNLFGEMVRARVTQVWINYHDLDGNGVWTHSTQTRPFRDGDSLPVPSPVPSLVFGSPSLAVTLLQWTTAPLPPTGRVLGVLPGSYPGPFRLSTPSTIVPAEHAHPVAIGRP